MALRVVYRSFGGTNDKGRPDWFTKELALRSMIGAARRAEAGIVFVNNGPIPTELTDLMGGVGEIVTLPGLGLRESFRRAVRLPIERGWPDGDVVYFCEDDYLHVPDALVAVARAAAELPADYFALYGSHETSGWDPIRRAPRDRRPRGWTPADPAVVGDVTWRQIVATTATFGVRVGALRADQGIMAMAGAGHRHMFRDRDMCFTYQGYEAHRWGHLAREALLLTPGGLRSRGRLAWLAPFKAAMNLRSHRLPRNRRVLMGADPNLATHCETPVLAPGRDWARIAAETHVAPITPRLTSDDLHHLTQRSRTDTDAAAERR